MVRTSSNDPEEQRVIDDVRVHGWHLVAVEGDSEGPGFVYSVGMFHTLRHPEIVLFGLNDVATMGQIVNSIGDAVRSGATFEDWHESDEILDGFSCMFRAVPVDVYPVYVGYAMWFHRPEPFPMLQCVWPDKQGRYPWQPDCHPDVKARQPILAQQLGWPFVEGKNRSVFTTKQVLEGGRPILRVCHDADGDWQFLCGTTNRAKDGQIVCLESIVGLCPAVAELADLPVGWTAVRQSPESPWKRSSLDE